MKVYEKYKVQLNILRASLTLLEMMKMFQEVFHARFPWEQEATKHVNVTALNENACNYTSL